MFLQTNSYMCYIRCVCLCVCRTQTFKLDPKGLCGVHMALLQVHMALLQMHRALLQAQAVGRPTCYGIMLSEKIL